MSEREENAGNGSIEKDLHFFFFFRGPVRSMSFCETKLSCILCILCKTDDVARSNLGLSKPEDVAL